MRNRIIQKTAVLLLKATIITTLIFWSGVVGADATAGTASTAANSDFLRIIYSGGLTGNIEPCG